MRLAHHLVPAAAPAHRESAAGRMPRGDAAAIAAMDIASWLSSLKPTYARFATAFAECGIEDVSDLSQLKTSEVAALLSALGRSGAGLLQRRRIGEALHREGAPLPEAAGHRSAACRCCAAESHSSRCSWPC